MEIVNCTEEEIYSMLRECNMDSNEADHRLNQDTFHEVKSKHEKEKEIKVSGESRSQRVSSGCRDYSYISKLNEEDPLFCLPPEFSLEYSYTIQPDDSDHNPYSAQSNLQMQTSAQLTSLTQPHLDRTPHGLLSRSAQPLREPELPSSHLWADQSMPANYIPAVPSFSGTTISLPEVSKSELHSQYIPQTTSSIIRPTLPSYGLSVPAYSQPTLPLGSTANLYTYPVLPHNIAYMQSEYSLPNAAVEYTLPQYISGMPLNGLYQTLPLGYGDHGSSIHIPPTFSQYPSNVATGTSVGYEEALRTQYMDGFPFQQSDNVAMWFHGLGSLPQPFVPSSSFYGIPEQGLHGGTTLIQAQHRTQMGTIGYQNLYHTQQLGAEPRRYQQLHPSLQENMKGSLGQSSQQSH